jgi:hypothetical protein
MKLRVCDAGRERIVPTSVDLVERTFAPSAVINDGTEITLTEGERWLAAIVIGAADAVSSRVTRSEALRQFREFVLASAQA